MSDVPDVLPTEPDVLAAKADLPAKQPDAPPAATAEPKVVGRRPAWGTEEEVMGACDR